MRAACVVIGLSLSLVGSTASARDGDADRSFGINGQVVMLRSHNIAGHASLSTGDLDVLADGRFIWAAPLKDGSVMVGRGMRNGAVDTTFGVNGTGRFVLPACGVDRSVRLISDGDSGAFVWSDGCLRHLFGDGSTDPAFGVGPMPPTGFFAADLARDVLGRIVLGGREGQLARVYRFDSTGVADPSFGNAGSVVVTVPVREWNEVNALVVRSDGRIVLGGSRSNTHGANLVLAQLLANGSPDTSWNDDGVVDMDAPPTFNSVIATALALDEDGSLVVSGSGNNGSNSCCIVVTRFDVAGQVVPTFGLRLYALPGSPSLSPSGERRGALVILADGRLLIGTTSFPFTQPFTHRTRFTLVRTLANGSVDVGFGNQGVNSYTIADPLGVGQAGDYNMLHAIGYDEADGSTLIFGRTFFEDNALEEDYFSLVRARLDLIFAETFD